MLDYRPMQRQLIRSDMNRSAARSYAYSLRFLRCYLASLEESAHAPR